MDKLASDYRSVYVWRDLEDVPAEEVAQRLGISIAAVKSRLHRAREQVRNGLDAALIKQPGTKKSGVRVAGDPAKQDRKAQSRED